MGTGGSQLCGQWGLLPWRLGPSCPALPGSSWLCKPCSCLGSPSFTKCKGFHYSGALLKNEMQLSQVVVFTCSKGDRIHVQSCASLKGGLAIAHMHCLVSYVLTSLKLATCIALDSCEAHWFGLQTTVLHFNT